MKNKIECAVFTGLLAACFAFPAAALPIPRQAGDVTYISGGIGAGEQQALKDSAGNYDLHVVNSDKTGHYTADINLTIASKDGREMVRVDNAGPLFYAELPPGKYVVNANDGQQHWKRDITVVSGKPVDLHMIWRE